MLDIEAGTGVLVRSDEEDVINRLRENERLRMRRAKIEEIRRKMREARERELEEEENEVEGNTTCKKAAEEKEGNQTREIFEKIGSVAGDLSNAAGNGLKSAPGQGVFRQLNLKGKGKIFKHIEGDTTFWRQLNKKGKGKIWRPNGKKVAAVNHVGTALLVVSVAVDAYEVYTAVREDRKNGTKHNTVHTVLGIAGTWTGGLPAAAAGAALGSAVPVVGSIIGGIVGGIIGSIGGGLAARTIAKTIMPAPKDREEDMIFETSGRCAFCSEQFACFDLFHDHFVQNHTDELTCLFSAVVSRAGEDSASMEDTWFISKAFVTDEDKIESWGMEDMLNFNDAILIKISWNIEEELDDDEENENLDGEVEIEFEEGDEEIEDVIEDQDDEDDDVDEDNEWYEGEGVEEEEPIGRDSFFSKRQDVGDFLQVLLENQQLLRDQRLDHPQEQLKFEEHDRSSGQLEQRIQELEPIQEEEEREQPHGPRPLGGMLGML